MIKTDELTPENLARYSFKYFFTKVLSQKWCSWHTQAYEDLQNQEMSNLLYEIARGHGKTVFFVSYALWMVYKGFPIDILIISYSEEQVRNNIMNLIDKMVMNNDYLAHLRPSNKQSWGAQLKTFNTGATIRGESFGSSVRGAHPDVLIIDDPLKDKGGMTPDEQYGFFMGALMGTTKRGTKVIVDGTPLDRGDLLEQLENNKLFVFRRFPAENDARTEALFPELFTLDELRKLEAVDSLAYSRERLLNRIDPKTQVFKNQFLTINSTSEVPQYAVVRTIIDPAISEKDRACDSAIVTVGVTYTNHVWEIDSRFLQADDPKRILDEVLKVATKLHKHFIDYAIVIESELFQKVLAYDLKQIILERGLDIRVIEVRHSGIQGKHERIIGLANKWEAKAIHLLPDSPLISQFKYYRPGIKGFKIDGIDAFSWIRNEDVNVPIVPVKIYDPGCSEAWKGL